MKREDLKNVVSYFDGISCGQVALEKVGIIPENYFAYEIDKHAIKVTQSNYPNTKQMGSVLDVDFDSLPEIDLLIGGSPCQGFSFSGKQLNFEDPRSKLFFEFVKAKDKLKPKYWMLENVKMKKEYQDLISKYLGCEPIIINSSLLSAQNRVRLYWTNIPNIEQPKDKEINLEDIVEPNMRDLGLTLSKDTLTFIPVDKHSSKSALICLGGVMKPTHKMWLNDGKLLQRNFSQGNRVYSEKGKATTLNANSGGIGGKTGLYEIEGVIRKLTQLECERLQTVPKGYTDSISKTQAIKALGNGWTVDIIAHIFKGMM